MKVVYPSDPLKSRDPDGEGNGALCMVRYDWEADTPYRVLIRQSRSKDNGNYLMAMRICGLSTVTKAEADQA